MIDSKRVAELEHCISQVTEDSWVKTLIEEMIAAYRAMQAKTEAAERLADAVCNLVVGGHLDSRSAASDALLRYRDPPRTPTSDRIAELEVERDRLRAALEVIIKMPIRLSCGPGDRNATAEDARALAREALRPGVGEGR